MGNFYGTNDNCDRVYGVGSRLEKSGVDTKQLKKPEVIMSGEKWKHHHVTKGTNYTYDSEGNLTAKKKPNGEAWQYEYFGNGMLKKIVLPDESEVTFKYDALGRRIEKQTVSRTVTFIWDGNNPIHERVGKDLTTWVFNDGFIPTAKLTKDGNYSIISDHLGTPVEAYDSEGKQVWAAELDIYGRVTRHNGASDFIPFRYQGQYDDSETGLYYNRFRYYDPNLGQYISQDPIGLAGGNPTLYGYVGDTNGWIDPLGLARSAGNGGNSQGNTTQTRAQQLATNAANGANAETLIYNRLQTNPNVTVLGRHVYIRTPGVGRGRYVDILIQNNGTMQLIAVEVKSGNAIRSVAQRAKDRLIASGLGIFGRNPTNTPAVQDLAGQLTTGIRNIVARVP